MNKQNLKIAESLFKAQYPLGFSDPQLLAIAKRHNMNKMIENCQDSFSVRSFDMPNQIVESMIKTVSRSSMVSMFEKPKFRDCMKTLNSDGIERMSLGLKELLHGEQEYGFEMLCEELRNHKLARWSLLTIIPTYYDPTVEVFVKPTTAKNILQHFEIENLTYNAKPSWTFYAGYRKLVTTMKQLVDPSLSPSNAAFTGFLMMSMRPMD